MKKKLPPTVDMSGSIQIQPGKWYRMDSPEITECCDCGLVHITEYRLEDGRFLFRSRVDRRATRAARKRDGITVTRKPHV